MNINKFTAVLCSALLFTGCNAVDYTNATAKSALQETNTDTAQTSAVIETAAETVVATTIATVVTTTESIATTELVIEDNAQVTKMKLPDSFYNELSDIIKSYPQLQYYNISLVYHDLESGFTFELNPNEHYYIASVIKAPYAMYIYRLALVGRADLTEKLTYTENFFVEGTGKIKEMNFGTEFTVEELIGYMIEWSDNCAYAMLRSVYPEKDYIEFTKELGIIHNEDLQVKNIEKICDSSAMQYGIALYNFFEEQNEYSEVLRQHMLKTRQPLIFSEQGEVVRKYGWYKGFIHDLAVVYAEKPYVLSIMADFGEGDDEGADENDMRIFKDLSLLIDRYSNSLEPANQKFSGIVVTSTTTITTVEKEIEEMILPNDPVMLLSYVNTKLRDNYDDLDKLCDDLDTDKNELISKLGAIGYEYNSELNKFY